MNKVRPKTSAASCSLTECWNPGENQDFQEEGSGVSTIDKTKGIFEKESRLLLKLATDLREVQDFFVTGNQKMIGTSSDQSKNKLTIYMNPGHAFVGLDCRTCDEGKEYHQMFGLYALDFSGKGVILDESLRDQADLSTVYSYPKAMFYLTDDQALSVINKKKLEELDPKYELFNRNCIDFAMEFAPIIGEPHFLEFFPELQISFDLTNRMNSLAYNYTVLKYKYGVNEDQFVFGFSVITAACFYVFIKTVSKLSNMFSKNKNPSERSLMLEIQKSTLFGKGAIVAARMAIGSENLQYMQVVKLVALAIPARTIVNELQSQEMLDKNKKPSFLNQRVPFLLSYFTITVLDQGIRQSTKIITGQETFPLSENVANVAACVGNCLIVLNLLRNTYHDVTAAPCLDGVDLR